MSTSVNNEICKCCNGTGVQINIYTGNKVRCGACSGSGYWNQPTYNPGTYCEVPQKSPAMHSENFYMKTWTTY